MPYGIVLWLVAPGCQNPWVDAFPIAGMACETGAVIEAAVCEGIECVQLCETGGLVAVSDALAAFDAVVVSLEGRVISENCFLLLNHIHNTNHQY